MSQAPAELALQSETDDQIQNIVDAAVTEVSHITTLPEVTVKIIEVVEDPESTAKDLHQIIANDPALCARVLKVVNSAFYGLPGQIGSINRAIVLLGLNAVKNIAIAASLAKLFRGGRLSPDFCAHDLWSHSLGVAATSKLIAEELEMKLLDEAFLAGLIHDIGLMVQMQTMRPKLLEVFDYIKEHHVDFLTAEKKVIGADHQQFGKGLCERWKFPRSLAFATGYHHAPMQLSPECRTLTCIVNAADILTARAKLGFSGTVATLDIDPQVMDELKLTESMIEQLCAKIPEAYEVADSILR